MATIHSFVEGKGVYFLIGEENMDKLMDLQKTARNLSN